MIRQRLILGVLALTLLAGGVSWWKLTRPLSIQTDADVVPSPHVSSDARVETEEEKARRKLLGVWHDTYKGKRTMTLKEDGAGTMLVELSGLQATLFAARLRFDMTWSLADNKLIKKAVGGEPADKVNLILNTMGNAAEDTILELTDNRLLLLDKDGTTRYDWRRVKKDEACKE